MPTLLSRAAVIVLRDLERADGKEVLKTAIKELIAAGAWRTRPAGRKRRRRAGLLLIPGGQSTRPTLPAPLPWVSRLIEAAPARVQDGEMARDLRDVAKHIARNQRGIRKRIVLEQLDALASAGLVDIEERRLLGIFPRRRYARTEEGEQRLAAELGAARERRREGAEGSYAGSGYVGGVYAGDPMDDPDHDADAGDVDAGLDASIDSSLDSSFDSSFDSAFDSSFDSGFDSGGGGNGGGDGGGGGNGGSG